MPSRAASDHNPPTSAPSTTSSNPPSRQPIYLGSGSFVADQQQASVDAAHLHQQHPSTPGLQYRYPSHPEHSQTGTPHPHLESDPTSPLTNSFGGSPGQSSQEASYPSSQGEPPHPEHTSHAPAGTAYVHSPSGGYSNISMPMYSGGAGGGSAATAPYPTSHGGFHHPPPHRGGAGAGAVANGAPPPPHHHGAATYIVQHHGGPPPPQMATTGYVLSGHPGAGAAGAPPHGYTMTYSTGVPQPGYAQHIPASSMERSGSASPAEVVRSSPSGHMHHHQAPPQYRHGGPPERTGSSGSGYPPEHTSMYPPTSSPTGMPHARILQRVPSGTGGSSPHPHHERASPHGQPPPGYHLSPHAPHQIHSSHMPPHTRPPPSRVHHESSAEKESSRSSTAVAADSLDDRTAEEIQAQRDRQAAEYELSLSRVKPITTDFHWFAKEQLAKEGVPPEIEDDLYLRNSYLNGRLKDTWESLRPEDRLEYLKQEEADRRRFTEEEEVASRHCATLTARAPTTSATLKRTIFGNPSQGPSEEEGESGPPKKAKSETTSTEATLGATAESSPTEVAVAGS